MPVAKSRLASAKALARAVARGETHPGLSQEQLRVRNLLLLFEMLVGEYKHQPTLRIFSSKVAERVKRGNETVMRKVGELADELEIDQETYLRAQFYWFDKWFHKAPTLRDLTSTTGKFPATQRALSYVELQKAGKTPNSVTSCVLPPKYTKDLLTDQKLDKINQTRLTDLCQQYQLSEDACLTRFAPAGLFDLTWLKQCKKAAFERLRGEGRL